MKTGSDAATHGVPESSTLGRTLRSFPAVAGVWGFAEARPRLAAWIVLSTGLCAALAVGGRDAAVPFASWAVLFAVGILVAGASVLIVTGEERDESLVSLGDSLPQTPAQAGEGPRSGSTATPKG